MKVASTSLVIVAVLACFVHDASAQQNWWERNPDDGTVAIASSRTSTTTPSTVATIRGIPANCRCFTTRLYDPVCGDNRITYANPEWLKCAQDCGPAVQLLSHGRCKKLL